MTIHLSLFSSSHTECFISYGHIIELCAIKTERSTNAVVLSTVRKGKRQVFATENL